MIEATVLLPNFNNERVLPLMFDYLRRNIDCSSVEFVMVDDGSEDKSVAVAKAELARTRFARAEIVELPHRGIVEALNAGLSVSRTPIILRIDGDATVETPNWDRRLCGWLNRFPELGIVGGQVVFDDGRLHSLGRAVFDEWGLRDMGCWPYETPGSRTSDAHVIRPVTRFVTASPYEVDTILGVCVAFRRSDALAAGGFDPRFSPVWIEDDDFGLQLRKIGKRALIDPQIQIVHRISIRNTREPGIIGKSTSRQFSLPQPGFARKTADDMRRLVKRIKREFSPPVEPKQELFSPNSLPAFGREESPWRIGVLQRHYATWRDKWGFDPLNPDVAALHGLFGAHPTLGWKLTPDAWSHSRDFARQAAEFAASLPGFPGQ